MVRTAALAFAVLALALAGCGEKPCEPATCAAAGATCGSIPDGCGGFVSCGGCPDSALCTDHKCVACEKRTCTPNVDCGDLDDGCGGTVRCGTCGGGLQCVRHQCQAPCEPKSCPAGACGDVDDGCGSTVSCGDCGAGETCGAVQESTCDASPDVCSPGAWTKFPERFFRQHCGACHEAYTQYATVSNCGLCRGRIQGGSMPPYGQPVLLESEKQLILQWFSCGSPR